MLMIAFKWIYCINDILVSVGHPALFRAEPVTVKTGISRTLSDSMLMNGMSEMFLALLPMVYIFLSLFVSLEFALMLMTLTTETYF